MNIGVIGSGNVGGTLGKLWGARGHSVLFSFSHDEEKLRRLAEEAGAGSRWGSPAEAAQFGDVVLLATGWATTEEALRQAGNLQGKILIDAVNPLKRDPLDLDIAHTTSAGEEIARWASGARVVKAFNTLGAVQYSKPVFNGQNASMLICGDDPDAKAVVRTLAEELDFDVVDCGRLTRARLLEPLALLWITLTMQEKVGEVAFKLLKR